MAASCPNRNSSEWKTLVSQVGENLAEITFVQLGHSVPDVRPITEIKKAIGFKTEVENFAGIAAKLKAYNRKNGTSHSFTKENIYGNTFKLTLKPNYLPVNLERQRQRLAQTNALFRVEETPTQRGFDTLYPYTPSRSEQAAGFFNEEGDFVPNADRNLYQLRNAMNTIENSIEELDNYLLDFLKPFGINSQKFDSLKDRLGVDALGATDIINKLIWYTKNRNVETVPEEAGHMIVALMGENNPIIKDLMEDITNWSEYAAIEKEYGPIYNNEKKVKVEAIGKLLAKSLVRNYKAVGLDKSLIEKALNWLVEFFSKAVALNNFNYSEKLADKIALNVLAGNTDFIGNLKPAAERLDYGKAIEGNDHAKMILKAFSEELGFPSTGSLAIAGQGESIYRPGNDPIHDLDFVVEEAYSEEVRKKLGEKLQELNAVPIHSGWKKEDYITASYYIPKKGYTVKVLHRKNGWAGKIAVFDENGNNVPINAQTVISTDFFLYKTKQGFKTKGDFLSWEHIYKGKLTLSPLGANEVLFQRDKDQTDYLLLNPIQREFNIDPSSVYYQLNPAQTNVPTDDSIAGEALRQVDTIRRMIPEEIQNKSQILTGRIDKTELSKQGFKDAQPNRTDLEVVSLYLTGQRFRLLSENEQNRVEQWADDWLNDSFIEEKLFGFDLIDKLQDFMKGTLKEIKEMGEAYEISEFNVEVLQAAAGIALDHPEANPNKEGYNKGIMFDSLIEIFPNKTKPELARILFAPESLDIVKKVFQDLENFDKEISLGRRVPRDEFIIKFYKGDIFEAAEEARRKGIIFVNPTDDLLPTGPAQIQAVERKRQNKFFVEEKRQFHKLKEAEKNQDIEGTRKALAAIEKLVELKENAALRVEVSEKQINSFEKVLTFGKTQLSEIRDIIGKNSISSDDLQYAKRVTSLWIKAGDFSTEPHLHPILDTEEFNTKKIRDFFIALRTEAEDIRREINRLEKEDAIKFVKYYTSEEITEEEIFAAIKDISWIRSRTINVGRSGDAMVEAVYNAIEQANTKAQIEAGEIWEELDELAAKFLKKSGGNYEILKQKTSDGKETGRLVTRFSFEFFEKRNQLIVNAFHQRDKKTGKIKHNKTAIDNYFNWLKNNTITFDARLLFPDETLEDGTTPTEAIYTGLPKYAQKAGLSLEEMQKQHKAELKKHLGEKGFEYYYTRMLENIKSFQTLREVQWEDIQTSIHLTHEEKIAQLIEWQKENSPYWAMELLENPARKKEDGTYYSPKGIRKFSEQIPIKVDSKGKSTGWYDNAYSKIEGDKDLYAYHQYVLETLQSMRYLLPDRDQKLMGFGILPTISKNIIDHFSEDGLKMGLTPFMDKIIELQTTTDFATEVKADIDPISGKIEKQINIPFIANTEAEVTAMLKTMLIKHRQKTGKPATIEERAQYTKEARHLISKEKSWDVNRIMKAHALNVLAYKHKAFIEPQVRMMIDKFEDREELKTTKTGLVKTKDGKEVSSGELKHLKESFEHFLDVNFFNIGGRKVEGVTKKKLYTKIEKKRKAELEALLEKATTEEKEQIQEELDKLGGFRTGSGIGDSALKFMTLKGIGWNLFSSISNIGFGLVSNITQASDNRGLANSRGLNSMQLMRKAYMLTFNSIARNYTFNNIDGVNRNGLKIRTFMDKWDLLQTSNKELFETSAKSSIGKLKRFGPYALQERSEYLNYAPVMVAVMLDFDAINDKGETVSLWDAYDKNGKLRKGYSHNVDEAKMVQKIKRMIEMNHGDYNNPLLVKSTFAGRALSQFRTWMFEGFANRFEAEKPDHILGYGTEEPYIRKGRYRSYTQGQTIATGLTMGTMLLPGVGSIIGAGAGYMVGAAFGMHSNESAISDTLFALKQLSRKLLFQKTQYEERFTEVDAGNMRKNATELYIMLGFMALGTFLKALVSDDEDEQDLFIANFLINQTTRLRTDIAFYTNPLEFENLTKTAVPLAQLVQDAYQIVTDISLYFDDDHKNEIFRSGPFKGNHKLFVHTIEAMPAGSSIIRTYKSGSVIY